MDGLSGANYRSSMRFQPIHTQNEVDVRRLQDNGRGIEFQPFDFHGDINANQGGLTLSHGGFDQYRGVHLLTFNVVLVCKIF